MTYGSIHAITTLKVEREGCTTRNKQEKKISLLEAHVRSWPERGYSNKAKNDFEIHQGMRNKFQLENVFKNNANLEIKETYSNIELYISIWYSAMKGAKTVFDNDIWNHTLDSN